MLVAMKITMFNQSYLTEVLATVWVYPVEIEHPFSITAYNWNDEDDGDGDGIMEAGENIRLKIRLKNNLDRTIDGFIDAYLSTADLEIVITEDRVYYDTFSPGSTQWPVGWHDIYLNFSLTKPDTHVGNFTLSITYWIDNLNYDQELSFTKEFK